MTDLEPIALDALTLDDANEEPPNGADRWQRVLDLVTEWLGEHRGNSRMSYADALGFPINVDTGQRRNVSRIRNGVSWLPWCLSHEVDPLEARRRHVVAWIHTLETTPHPDTGRLLSKSTRSHMVSALSAFYKHLVQEGHTEINPVQVNRKKLGVSVSGDASPTRSLSIDEVRQLQMAADRDHVARVRLRSSALVATLFGVGMRVSELVGLDIGDLRVIQGFRALPLRLKGDRYHWSAVPDEALHRLDAYLAARPDLERRPVQRGQVGGTARPLFTTSSGRRLARTDVNELLRRLARQSGLVDPDSIHPHVARHSFVTAGRRQGITESDIQRQLGHKDPRTTGRYGQHVLDLERSPVHTIAASYLPPLEDSLTEG